MWYFDLFVKNNSMNEIFKKKKLTSNFWRENSLQIHFACLKPACSASYLLSVSYYYVCLRASYRLDLALTDNISDSLHNNLDDVYDILDTLCLIFLIMCTTFLVPCGYYFWSCVQNSWSIVFDIRDHVHNIPDHLCLIFVIMCTTFLIPCKHSWSNV